MNILLALASLVALSIKTSGDNDKLFSQVCHKVLDIGILMDSSYNIQPSVWEAEKSIAASLVDQLDIHPSGTHISVMTFSTDVNFPVPFNGYTNSEDLKRKIVELTYHNGRSRIDLGLLSVKKQMFTSLYGARNIKDAPRALVLISEGKTEGPADQDVSLNRVVTQAADDLKNADVTILCVQLGASISPIFENIASDSTLIFRESDIEALIENLVDISKKVCSDDSLPVKPPSTAQAPDLKAAPKPQTGIAPIPHPLPQCPIAGCTFPSICIVAVYPVCIAPTSSTSSSSTSCPTPGACLTTVTTTEIDTATTTTTKTDTQTSTEVATVTNTETETLTSTALTTQTHTETDVVTSTAVDTRTSTLTTTDTQIATSTHHKTQTSTAVVTDTATKTHVDTKTVTAVTTSTAVDTSTQHETSTHTLTTTNTDIVTSTKIATSTTTLTTTSTGVATSTLVTTATKTNTVNTTQKATETLTKTLTTIATDTLTSTHHATNIINITATSTATRTATTTAKTTQTLTATRTATLTETQTYTENTTMTHVKTVTDVSTSVVTTCSASCSKIEPTPSLSSSITIPPTTPPHVGCMVNYTKLGCFKDKKTPPRLLPDLLFTDRDSTSKVYSNIPIKWNKWDTYMMDLVCRCANAASAKKYRYFSLQFHGECWSGKDAGETFHQAGISDNCITTGYAKCNPTDEKECVGKRFTNFVYGIREIGPPITPVPVTVPPTAPPPPPCKKALDIGVIIDSSDSISLNDYKLCLQFFVDLVNYFKVLAQGTHFGAIVYSDSPQLQFNFADAKYYEASRLKEKIETFPYLAHGTRTDLALSLANLELFSDQGGDRSDKPNVLIVITDGRTHPILSKPYPEVLKPLKEKKVRIIAVGVGGMVEKKELTAIALGDPNHVFTVSQYKDLVQILRALLKESCMDLEDSTVTPPSRIGIPPATTFYTSSTRGKTQTTTSITKASSKENCPIDFVKKGCFNDLANPRALPYLLFTDIDNTSSSFSDFPVDWGSWDDYLGDVVCRCAQRAKAKGYSYFGIENFGECWSGVTGSETYNKDGASEFCITREFKQCDVEDPEVCCGNETTVFVYGIKEQTKKETCYTQFENVGCYADRGVSPRPLPKLLFTDIDASDSKYSGKLARLGELDTYLWDVLCRCAEHAQELDYEYFGLQNHGECYSGTNAATTYRKDGPSTQCIKRDFQVCPFINSTEGGLKEGCVGSQGSNYVYRVISVNVPHTRGVSVGTHNKAKKRQV